MMSFKRFFFVGGRFLVFFGRFEVAIGSQYLVGALFIVSSFIHKLLSPSDEDFGEVLGSLNVYLFSGQSL